MRKLQKLFLIPFILLSIASQAQSRVIKGTVVSANGPVIGASVMVSGQTKGTTTDAEGNFSLNVPDGKTTLAISSVGFNSKQLAENANESQITITLEEAKGALQEVVVTALGIKREKKELTYATQQIGGDEITKAANTN